MPEPLKPEELYRFCDILALGISSSDDLPSTDLTIGQTRAQEALYFGVRMPQDGFNIYAQGPSGLGKSTTARRVIQVRARQQQVPDDWVYVNNFQQPDKPVAMRFSAGSARDFKMEMQHLVEDLSSAIPSAFDAEEYHARRQEIDDELKDRLESSFSQLNKEAERQSISLLRTPQGFALAPIREGNVLSPGEFQQLPEEEQNKIKAAIENLEESLNTIMRQQPQLQREAREKIKLLNREVALFAAGHFIEDLKTKYVEHAQVPEYLDEVLEDVLANLDDFRRETREGVAGLGSSKPDFHRYRVNVLVDNGDCEGAPVVYEDNPTYHQLIGRIEHKSQMGALFTNFTMIKPGVLHRANGGYLLLDARKVLQHPFAWDGLKRTLHAKQVKIQPLEQWLSMMSTSTLEPEAISLDVKVVLLGDRFLYYLLHDYDEEFAALFKVSADFDEQVSWQPENLKLYAQLIANLVKENSLLAFDGGAIARVIEYGARLIEDQQNVSINLSNVLDLLREAEFWAREADAKQVNRGHVQTAVDKKIYRSDRVRQHLYEQIQRRIYLIDTGGAKVGQVNGLAVIQVGDFSFAKPSRITATTRMGDGEVVDIEREVELGGAIHSKGVLILSAFLAAHYARDVPLSLSASLVFEQNYGLVDGDSASMAELCALLSSLSACPIEQRYAMTGSVNQLGQAQPIGGVNEKIEGFFDVCRLNGELQGQGVIIPRSNVGHLMLREDVIEAVRKGKFLIHAIDHVFEAMAVITGEQPGEADAQGGYPEGSINARVEYRLREMAHAKEQFGRKDKDEHDSDEQDGDPG